MWLSVLIKYSIISFGILTLIRWVLRRKWGSVDKMNEMTAKGKIVLVTGASNGIGKATAMEFASRDANVIFACRDLDKAVNVVNWIRNHTSRGQLICMKLDLASLQSVRKFCQDFKTKYDRLDILVNNAGVLVPAEEKRKTSDGFEIHMGVNHLGHFLLTNLLLEQLKKAAPSRIINVSSVAHSWSKLDLNDIMSEKAKVTTKFLLISDLYSRSKLANALFNKELAKKLQGTGVRTYGLCPGMVVTNLGQADMKDLTLKLLKPIEPLVQYLLKTPKEGAATTMYCALSKNLIHDSGEMYQHCAFWHPKDRAVLKDEDAKKLWDISAKLVGL